MPIDRVFYIFIIVLSVAGILDENFGNGSALVALIIIIIICGCRILEINKELDRAATEKFADLECRNAEEKNGNSIQNNNK